MKSDLLLTNTTIDRVKENTRIQWGLTKLANRITLTEDKASILEETIRKCEKTLDEMPRAKT